MVGKKLSTPEAAAILGVSGQTLKRWHKQGLIADRLVPSLGPGGHYRWPEDAVWALAHDEVTKIAAELDRREEIGGKG